MPCNSDYMEPSSKERQLQETAKLYRWLRRRLSMSLSKQLVQAARDVYCRHDYTAKLCGLVRSLDKEQQAQLLYNGRVEASRRLASWWERHQKADEARKKEEATARKLRKLAEQARAKLTNAEYEALLMVKNAD